MPCIRRTTAYSSRIPAVILRYRYGSGFKGIWAGLTNPETPPLSLAVCVLATVCPLDGRIPVNAFVAVSAESDQPDRFPPNTIHHGIETGIQIVIVLGQWIDSVDGRLANGVRSVNGVRHGERVFLASPNEEIIRCTIIFTSAHYDSPVFIVIFVVQESSQMVGHILVAAVVVPLHERHHVTWNTSFIAARRHLVDYSVVCPVVEVLQEVDIPVTELAAEVHKVNNYVPIIIDLLNYTLRIKLL